MLYIICDDTLCIMLRNNNNITGIKLPGVDMESILFQHAYDTTLTVLDRRSIGESKVLPIGESANIKCKFKSDVTNVT